MSFLDRLDQIRQRQQMPDSIPAPQARPIPRWIQVLGCLALMLLAALLVSVPMGLEEQTFFAAVCFGFALLLRRLPGRLPVIMLIVLSLLASLRYLYWRLTATLGFETPLEMVLGYGLADAELYALGCYRRLV